MKNQKQIIFDIKDINKIGIQIFFNIKKEKDLLVKCNLIKNLKHIKFIDISDILYLLTGNYFNIEIEEYKYYKTYKNNLIISLEHYLYFNIKYNLKIFKNIQNNINIINKNLRLNINYSNDLIIKFNKIITNSASLDYDIILYRGLDIKLNVNIGDILDNLGFMFASINENTALMYCENNTSGFYSGNSNIKLDIPGTLLKILVKKHINFLSNDYPDFCSSSYINNEIIFDSLKKLKIMTITDKYIECELF